MDPAIAMAQCPECSAVLRKDATGRCLSCGAAASLPESADGHGNDLQPPLTQTLVGVGVLAGLALALFAADSGIAAYVTIAASGAWIESALRPLASGLIERALLLLCGVVLLPAIMGLAWGRLVFDGADPSSLIESFGAQRVAAGAFLTSLALVLAVGAIGRLVVRRYSLVSRAPSALRSAALSLLFYVISFGPAVCAFDTLELGRNRTAARGFTYLFYPHVQLLRANEAYRRYGRWWAGIALDGAMAAVSSRED